MKEKRRIIEEQIKLKKLYVHTDLYIAADHHHNDGLWCYWGSMAHKIVHVQIKGSLCFCYNISAWASLHIFINSGKPGLDRYRIGKTFEESQIVLQTQIKASMWTKAFYLLEIF